LGSWDLKFKETNKKLRNGFVREKVNPRRPNEMEINRSKEMKLGVSNSNPQLKGIDMGFVIIPQNIIRLIDVFNQRFCLCPVLPTSFLPFFKADLTPPIPTPFLSPLSPSLTHSVTSLSSSLFLPSQKSPAKFIAVAHGVLM